MSPLLIAQLIIALGPPALQLIPELAALWNKSELTPQEVLTLCSTAQKSYDQYVSEAKARLSP